MISYLILFIISYLILFPNRGNSVALLSAKAIIHEKRMTPISGQWDDTPVCCNFRWPYQASVMKMLLLMSSKMV